MGARHDICKMVKRAQSITGYMAPTSRQDIKSQKYLGNAINRGLWGAFGAAAGLLKNHIDNSFFGHVLGFWPKGEVEDYLKAGWNVGKDNANLMNASIAEGAADFIPFADGLKAKAEAWADREQKKRMASGLGKDDAVHMRTMGALGGNLAPTAFLRTLSRGTGAASGGTAKLLGAGDKITNAARVAGAGAPGAAVATSAWIENNAEDQKENTALSIDGYRKLLEDVKNLDPSSPEYAEKYEKLKLGKVIDPEGFGALPIPTVATEPEPEAANGWTSWYNGLPDWQKTLAWGAGGAGIGALLGSLFGGKGSGWRMALLGMLLGAMGGNGNIGKLWNSIRGGQNTQAVG